MPPPPATTELNPFLRTKGDFLARGWSLLALPLRAETIAHSRKLKVSARPSIESRDRRMNGNPSQGLVFVQPRLLEEAKAMPRQ
ncbi:hypothetical protein NL676_031509 [Syzygium grande]|nr:hypothetical protein NL676_031509 [Syzygium grande]